MSETGSLPDLGGQVRPLIQALPVGVQPRIMATLERAAAARYRTWAGVSPEPMQAEGLRACAAREEGVAARIEMAFPPQSDEQRHIGGVLPQTLASSAPDASVREILSACAQLEGRSAEFLEAIVNRHS